MYKGLHQLKIHGTLKISEDEGVDAVITERNTKDRQTVSILNSIHQNTTKEGICHQIFKAT